MTRSIKSKKTKANTQPQPTNQFQEQCATQQKNTFKQNIRTINKDEKILTHHHSVRAKKQTRQISTLKKQKNYNNLQAPKKQHSHSASMQTTVQQFKRKNTIHIQP